MERSQQSPQIRVLFIWWTIVPLVLIMSGCSDVSKEFRIDTGIDPRYQDDEVRFRTTYYLRVFDLCDVGHWKNENDGLNVYESRLSTNKTEGGLTTKTHGSLYIAKDSLHRFRMTGKASALFNDLHFESGIMDANALDPFGKTIDFSEEQNTFIVPSHSTKNLVSPPPSGNTNPDKSEGNPGSNLCPSGNPKKQKFFLLGPEGSKELRPNDRLVMAMYTNAKPLINTLNNLAGQKSNQEAKVILPFELELHRTRAQEALSIVNKAIEQETTPDPTKISANILNILGEDLNSSTQTKTAGNSESIADTLKNTLLEKGQEASSVIEDEIKNKLKPENSQSN